MQRGRSKKRAAEQEGAATESQYVEHGWLIHPTKQKANTGARQQMQAIRVHLARSKGGEEEVRKFREKVTEDKQNLKTLLQHRVQQA